MPLPEDTLQELTRTAFEALLAVDIEVSSHAEWEAHDDYRGSWVGIAGTWTGRVLVICSARAALHAASEMLQVPREEATDTDVLDAMRELVNVLGGQIMALMPAGSKLGLPTAGACPASGFDGEPAGARVEIWMCCAGEPVIVRLLQEAETEAEPASGPSEKEQWQFSSSTTAKQCA